MDTLDLEPMDTDLMVPTPTTELMATSMDTLDLEPMDTDLMVPTPTTELMATSMDTLDLEPMDTDLMVPTPTTDLMATTLLARGLLMLSPLLMPTTTDIPPMDTDLMVPTPTEPDTTDTIKLPISTKDLPSSRNENQLPQPATKDLKFPFLFV